MRLSSAGDPMIYRSRYLDRLSFSPLGYRQTRRPQSATRPQPNSEPHNEAGRESFSETLEGAVAVPAQPGQRAHLGECAVYLSSRELREVVARCEKTITSGQAQIEDYEAFVICQQELSSRL